MKHVATSCVWSPRACIYYQYEQHAVMLFGSQVTRVLSWKIALCGWFCPILYFTNYCLQPCSFFIYWTLSALLAPRCSVPGLSSGIPATGQQYTMHGGHSELPNTTQELSVIKEYAKATCNLQLGSSSATGKAALNMMEEHHWFHLACHTIQNKDNPAWSAFHIHDDDLTLSTIAQKSFKIKWLTFLSACQTTTSNDMLPDESVHLEAGMLMARYRSVIATMWVIQEDEDAPDIAQTVHASPLKDGSVDFTEVASALHKAVTYLCTRVEENSFGWWVPFVHMGSWNVWLHIYTGATWIDLWYSSMLNYQSCWLY